ncbi:amidase [Thermomonospora curvata]|uniref:Amidase n=1 Tax=Thermomonospora curvata (strain ATCC 19995 / DSM 43183 / JCM 3096 / KCTC 9072 / NBRC 15933 / NCIMB 10081 / Henssen B9) TaxID=471852 RepID=D1AAI3_THECD|nr:amidase [Thermomonospora curvata]ACY98896.1 Amidase [Thermomonospora curvata DSM 43183]
MLDGLGLAAQAELLALGELSAGELVAHSLERIDRLRSLGAFRVVRAEAALAEAAEADRRLRAGERLPLLGVPVAIKDDTDLAGETTPFAVPGDHRPKAADAEHVRRLRAAGAIIVGKTTTCEIGLWPFSESPGFGAARNPWNPAYSPGGSSGGSAAAVAAGMVAAAVGSDGAGSIRIPAAWTGLVGIKPQRGRVSGFPHRDPFHGLTVWGPLARSVADAALLLDVLTGSHPEDAHRLAPPVVPFAEAARRDPGRLRIAVSFRTAFGVPGRVDPQIRAAVERIARRLADLGHKVFPADPDYGLVGLGLIPRGTAGVADWLESMPGASPEPRTEVEARIGRLLGRRLLPLARRMDPALRRRVGRIFQVADVVLTPTTALPPPRVGAYDGATWRRTQSAAAAACPYAWPWNVLGWPAMSVPAGMTAEGLPIGAQLLAHDSEEALLISLAAQLEAVEGWHERRAPLKELSSPEGAQ